MEAVAEPSSRAVRVLWVGEDDSAAERAAQGLALHPEVAFHVARSRGLEPTLAWLREHPCDVLLLHSGIGDGASEVLERARAEFPALPIALLDDLEDAATGPAGPGGARDPDAKEAEASQLGRLVLEAMTRHRAGPEPSPGDHHRATRDPLTGMLNREAFRERLCESLARSRRYGQAMAVLVVDLDRFGAKNEQLGRAAGDEILRIVAERLRRALRAGDPVARFGDDEFTAIVHNAHEDRDLGVVAQRLLDELAVPVSVQGQALSIEASVGIALYPSDGVAADELLRNADTAMYHAKSGGRGRYHFFEKGVDRAVANQLRLESSLRRATERDELLLHYQPQVDLSRRQIIGVEALLRWRSEGGGVVEAASFLPAAENLGLMGEMGEWTLRNACREIAALRLDADSSLSLSVNVSASQLTDPGFVDRVSSALRESGLPERLLEIEVSDEVLGRNLTSARSKLVELRRSGVRITLDAFGLGRASLQSVRRIPFDTIKIDRSFVQGLGSDPAASAVVGAIVTLCRGLGCSPAAVGVEREEQAEALLRLGCSRMQGFAFSVPIAVDQLEETVRLPMTAAVTSNEDSFEV